MNNFEFEHEGKKLWYSRSLACNIMVYRRTTEDEWEVLACKRGQGCEFNKGLWNIPGGFIDFNEDSVECALRELKEETGVVIKNKCDVFFNKLDTKPHGKRQTMVASHYACFIEEDTYDWEFSTENGEPGETEEIAWIPLKHINQFKWTHGQKELIENTFEIHRINFTSYTNSRRNEIRMHQLSHAFEDFNRNFEGMF
jgi:ADP-ribose pyrophosphatase YjhB (NUDIX family)